MSRYDDIRSFFGDIRHVGIIISISCANIILQDLFLIHSVVSIKNMVIGTKMKTYSRLIFLLLLATVAVGCNSSQNTKDYSDALIVLPGASKVSYDKVNKTDQVWYVLKVDYPANEVINQLSKQLDIKGWSPLKEDYMNPGIPTSFVRGWQKYEDMSKQPNTVVHSWNSDWQNKNGDILLYILGYRYPFNAQPDMTTLSVVAIYVPANIVQAMKKASLDMLRKYNKQNSGEK